MTLQFTNAERTAATFNGESFSLAGPEDWDSIGNGPTREAVKKWLAAGNSPLLFVGESLSSVKKRLSDDVDEYIGNLTIKFERFSREYEMREIQAQAYRDSSYVDPVPDLVAGFATPARLAPDVAADRILSQALNLRNAIPLLGNLRMRKYEISYATTKEGAQVIHDDVIAQAKLIAANL